MVREASARAGLLARERRQPSGWPAVIALLVLAGLTLGTAGYWLP